MLPQILIKVLDMLSKIIQKIFKKKLIVEQELVKSKKDIIFEKLSLYYNIRDIDLQLAFTKDFITYLTKHNKSIKLEIKLEINSIYIERFLRWDVDSGIFLLTKEYSDILASYSYDDSNIMDLFIEEVFCQLNKKSLYNVLKQFNSHNIKSFLSLFEISKSNEVEHLHNDMCYILHDNNLSLEDCQQVSHTRLTSDIVIIQNIKIRFDKDTNTFVNPDTNFNKKYLSELLTLVQEHFKNENRIKKLELLNLNLDSISETFENKV